MNLRRQRPSDSLDMLLDTMCNTFGGIILLAVLVTLLTSRERHDHAASTSDTQEMLERRLSVAQADLQQALELQQSLQTRTNDSRWRIQVSLLAARQEIQNEIRAVRELAAESAKELDLVAGADPAERMKALTAQLATAEAKRLATQNSLTAARENAERLATRLAGLEQQVANRVNESQRELRLPKEHETGKRVIYVIARYGRIYPCRNSDLSRNETDIEWTSTISSEIAEPKRARGIDPASNVAWIRAYFRSLSGNSVYVAFCVFEDSFPAFIRAKQVAAENGLAYGWEPFRFTDGPVTFSAVGHRPKPQ